MNLTTFLSDIGAVLGILGVASFVFAYVKSDITKKTVEQLKELADALEMRVKALEDEKEMMASKIEHLENENETLRSLLDGSENSQALQDRIDQNHRELLTLFEKTIEKIERLVSR